MGANCISLRHVPSCALLPLGQEYRCILRNVCLAQLYRGASKVMNWEVHLSSSRALPFTQTLYQSETRSVVFQQHPLGHAVCLGRAGFHRARDKQDISMPKSSARAPFNLSPPAQQLFDQGRELTELRTEVNLKIFFSTYFLIYLLLLHKCYSNSDILDLGFTAQINY